MGRIKNMGTATMQFKEGIIVTGSAHNPNGTDSAYAIVISGSAYVEKDIKLKGKLDVIATYGDFAPSSPSISTVQPPSLDNKSKADAN